MSDKDDNGERTVTPPSMTPDPEVIDSTPADETSSSSGGSSSSGTSSSGSSSDDGVDVVIEEYTPGETMTVTDPDTDRSRVIDGTTASRSIGDTTTPETENPEVREARQQTLESQEQIREEVENLRETDAERIRFENPEQLGLESRVVSREQAIEALQDQRAEQVQNLRNIEDVGRQIQTQENQTRSSQDRDENFSQNIILNQNRITQENIEENFNRRERAVLGAAAATQVADQQAERIAQTPLVSNVAANQAGVIDTLSTVQPGIEFTTETIANREIPDRQEVEDLFRTQIPFTEERTEAQQQATTDATSGPFVNTAVTAGGTAAAGLTLEEAIEERDPTIIAQDILGGGAEISGQAQQDPARFASREIGEELGTAAVFLPLAAAGVTPTPRARASTDTQVQTNIGTDSTRGITQRFQEIGDRNIPDTEQLPDTFLQTQDQEPRITGQTIREIPETDTVRLEARRQDPETGLETVDDTTTQAEIVQRREVEEVIQPQTNTAREAGTPEPREGFSREEVEVLTGEEPSIEDATGFTEQGDFEGVTAFDRPPQGRRRRTGEEETGPSFEGLQGAVENFLDPDQLGSFPGQLIPDQEARPDTPAQPSVRRPGQVDRQDPSLPDITNRRINQRRRGRNRSSERTGLSSIESVFTGINLRTEEDIGLDQQFRDDQVQQPDQRIDLETEQDLQLDLDTVNPRTGRPFRPTRAPPRRSDSRMRITIRPGRGRGLGGRPRSILPFEDGSSSDDEVLQDLGLNVEQGFAPSVDALITGQTAEDDSIQEETLSGFETRPIVTDNNSNQNNNENDLEGLFF